MDLSKPEPTTLKKSDPLISGKQIPHSMDITVRPTNVEDALGGGVAE